MKSKEELEALKKEYENLKEKISKLTDDEMEQIVGAWWGKEYERKNGLDLETRRSKDK